VLDFSSKLATKLKFLPQIKEEIFRNLLNFLFPEEREEPNPTTLPLLSYEPYERKKKKEKKILSTLLPSFFFSLASLKRIDHSLLFLFLKREGTTVSFFNLLWNFILFPYFFFRNQ
jgi:hypothetical protein